MLLIELRWVVAPGCGRDNCRLAEVVDEEEGRVIPSFLPPVHVRPFSERVDEEKGAREKRAGK